MTFVTYGLLEAHTRPYAILHCIQQQHGEDLFLGYCIYSLIGPKMNKLLSLKVYDESNCTLAKSLEVHIFHY
jgi:hypothetical protein